jgi:transketolase
LQETCDVKIVAVTSPQLFEELRHRDPEKARAIFSDADRALAITLHNGWGGFLYPFLLPADHTERTFGMDAFSRSGKPNEIYKDAAFDPDSLKRRILDSLQS